MAKLFDSWNNNGILCEVIHPFNKFTVKTKSYPSKSEINAHSKIYVNKFYTIIEWHNL